MAVLPTGIGPVTGYNIERSLRFNSADSAYLNRTPASATNRTTWTVSFWVKRGALGSRQEILGNINSTGLNGVYIEFLADDTFQFGEYASALWNWQLTTTAVFRDPSAWYHIVLSADTTQATNTNRFKIYVNGVQVTVFGTSSYPSQNFNTAWNTTQPISIGRNGQYNTLYLNSYLTEIYNIDGQALTPSSFGETDSNTGVWKPKAYSGTYGTNGFFLKFADNSGTTSTTLGKDSSGNGNNWTPNNFSVTAGAGNDSLVDSPTAYGTDTGVGGEVRGNYATWNPLDKDDGITSVTNGNLNVVTNGSNGSIKSTIAFPSGKWYWEVTSDAISGSGTQAVGIIPQSQPPTNNMSDSGKLGYALDVSFSDRKFENGTATSYGTYTQANGAVYMLAFDQDAGKLWYGVNGTWLASGAPASGTNPSSSSISTSTAYCAAVSDNTVSGTFTINFGQRAFAYTAPSGFKALCTTNLPTPTIGATSTTLAGKYFNPVLYTGNGSTQSITGVGFQPDWVWLKSRSNATDHELTDAVRGATKSLISNSTAAEATDTNGLTAFNSDGFSLGTDANYNGSARTYVAWNWNAGGSTVTNTSGTISAQVRANTTSGFSIATFTTPSSFTNATVGHGLGVAPSMIIVKRRTTGDWITWHTSLGTNGYVTLNTTSASSSNSGSFNGTSSTTWTLGSNAWWQASASDWVAYCFAPVAGYSAFGSYTGNGSTDGPMIFTGFRPRYVMVKRTDASGNEWEIRDTARDSYNSGTSARLWASSSASELNDFPADILSNGFKPRSTGTNSNGSGATYIYMAFAETPFKYSLGR